MCGVCPGLIASKLAPTLLTKIQCGSELARDGVKSDTT